MENAGEAQGERGCVLGAVSKLPGAQYRPRSQRPHDLEVREELRWRCTWGVIADGRVEGGKGREPACKG